MKMIKQNCSLFFQIYNSNLFSLRGQMLITHTAHQRPGSLGQSSRHAHQHTSCWSCPKLHCAIALCWPFEGEEILKPKGSLSSNCCSIFTSKHWHGCRGSSAGDDLVQLRIELQPSAVPLGTLRTKCSGCITIKSALMPNTIITAVQSED